MRTILAAMGCALLVGGVAFAEPVMPKAPMAKAVLVNAKGEEVGTATFEEMPGGLRVGLKVSKLSPGFHAFHIHAVGKCDPPDFKSAGGHFNPTHKKHGWQNPEGHHAGDLPNLYVGTDGTGTLDALVAGVTLTGSGENSLFHPEGTSAVIHASADDNKTDPSGNAGDRIACGVITRVP